ncbi:MAG: DegT/DnrJ/EryC1/StrS aminotransferase family protein [Paracoccaceae bacterium]
MSKTSENIPYTKPSITDLEARYTSDASVNGWGNNCYDYIKKFELHFAKHIGTKHALATSSCTGALTLGLVGLGIVPDDEIIVADTNWIATVAPIVHLGAKPVFIDIYEDSWCIDDRLIEAAITKRTKAIIATHLYGNLCNMDAINEIANKHNLAVIEDSAEAIGAQYKGKRAGSMGNFGVFSFHGTKTITTGEGGMLVTNDSQLYQKVLTLNNHGRNSLQPKQFWADELGFKFKMSNIQAALGCAQLERIDELTSRKREILHKYKELTRHIPGLKMNVETFDCINGAWMPTAVFNPSMNVTREYLLQAFRRDNIDARVFFWPLSSLPMFETNLQNVNAYSIPNRAINLPSFHDITNTQIQRVVDVLVYAARN